MGTIVSLDEYRARRVGPTAAMARLDRAIARLEPLARGAPGRLSATLKRELIGIGRAVSAGRPAEAAERAERLADRLEHPAAMA